MNINKKGKIVDEGSGSAIPLKNVITDPETSLFLIATANNRQGKEYFVLYDLWDLNLQADEVRGLIYKPEDSGDF